MSKIDKRIVEMAFENKGFEKGIKESSSSLKDFNNALEKTGKGDTGSSLSKLGGIAEGVGNKFSLLGTIATGALLKIGAQAVETGIQLVKSLTLDQVMAGFAEYELKINAIRTILAGGRTAEGLPVTLDMVNEKLAELNEYADQTIYSFSDMTANIGKFTNAGVDLDLAVASIKGISNVAAVSGANTNEAARAMYNFAQALSAGYVKFIDWKSIENANMATVEFKEQLLESAVAAGTLEKTADGMYKVLSGGGHGGKHISATKEFNQSLQDQWLTTEVLTSTLQDYSDATTEIGAKATEAATKVRTFSQLMDTVKEAIGSGWAVTFENIFGDYEEATELWSGMSDALNEVISNSADARNKIVGDWKRLGGRDALIEGLSAVWKTLGTVMLSVKEAWTDTFGTLKRFKLTKITRDFRDFLISLTPTAAQIVLITNVFEGLFSALSLGWGFASSIFKGIADGIKGVLDSFSKADGDGLLGFASTIATFFIELNDAAKKGEIFSKISEGISDSIVWFVDKVVESYNKIKDSKLAEVISELLTFLKDSIAGFTKDVDLEETSSIFDSIKSFFEDFSLLSGVLSVLGEIAEILQPVGQFLIDFLFGIKDSISGVWETEGLSGLVDIFTALVHGGILLEIQKFIKTITGFADSASGLTGGISGIFRDLGGILRSYQDTLKAKTLKEIAIAVAILAGSVLALSLINAEKLEGATSALALLFIELGTSFAVLQKLVGGKGMSKMAMQLIMISSAILVLSIAVKAISDIPADQLKNSVLALGAILLELGAFSKLMSNTKGFLGAAVALTALSVAINIIVLAIKGLGKMDPGMLQQGLIALGLIMLEMSAFAIILSQVTKGGKLLLAAAAIDILVIGILELVGIVALLGSFDPENLKQGLIGLGLILGEIALFSIVISNTIKPAKLLAAAASMNIMGLAILEIVGAVAILGGMDREGITQGLIGLAASLGIMGATMIVLGNPSVLLGAAAMIVMATAIAIFTPAILALGAVPLENIGKALLSLVGIFAIVGAAATFLTPLIPSILGLAAAIAVLGVGVLAIGGGLMLFGAGLAALSAGGTAAIGLLIYAIKEIIELLPFILTKVGDALIALANIIIEGAPAIAGAVVAVFSSLIILLSGELPKLVLVVLEFIETLLTALVEKVPKFTEAAMKIILGFLEGINSNVGAVVEAIFDLLINILSAIAEKLPDVLAAGISIVTSLLEGIGQEVPKVVDAAFQMVIDFINGLADSIRTNTPLILDAAANLATAFTDGIKDYLNIGEGESIAGNLIKGLINGILSGVGDVVKAAKNLGRKILDGIKGVFDESSPSKETEEMGMNLDLGLIKGIVKIGDKVVQAAKDVGEKAMDGLRSAMSDVSDVVNSELDTNPTITPVLNLDQVRSEAGNLASMLPTNQTYSLAVSQIRQDREVARANQNGSTIVTDTGTGGIRNEFNLNGVTIRSEADIDILAEKLYRKQEQAMRSRGMKPSLV